MTVSPSPAGGSLTTRVALLIACLGCALPLAELRSRFIDPDEFEHLHAGLMVSRGLVPYRDFFEHHGPAFYYFLLPFFKVLGPHLSVLWWGRAAMWLCSLGTLALTFRLGRRIGGRDGGSLAAALLVWASIFHAKEIELRPDVPATLLILVMATVVIERRNSCKSWILAGLLAGLATLFTQKAIVPIAGLACAGMLRELIVREARQGIKLLLSLAVGGAAAWGMAFVLFGLTGAAQDLWHGTVVQLFAWPVRSNRWDYLRPTLAADLTVWIAASAEIVCGLRSLWNREDWISGRAIVVFTAAFSTLALVWVKATYPQFYLLWFPFLAILAGRRLAHWCANFPSRSLRIASIAGGILLTLAELWLWQRAAKIGQAGSLPALTGYLETSGVIGKGLILATMLLMLAGVIAFAFSGRSKGVMLLLALMGMSHAVLRNVDFALRSNVDQVHHVEVLHHHVPPAGRVLDGFSGYGALRPHAYYFWWINQYSLALMTPAEREGDLLVSLQRSPPNAILFDEHLSLLPRPITNWIRKHYAPLAEEPWLWMPRSNDAVSP